MKYLLIVFGFISMGFIGCGPQSVTPEVSQGVILSHQPVEGIGPMHILSGTEHGSQKECELRVFAQPARFQLGFESASRPLHHCHAHGHGHSHHDHDDGDEDEDECHAKEFQYFPLTELHSRDSANALIHATHPQFSLKIGVIDQGLATEALESVEVQAKLHTAGQKGLVDVVRVCNLNHLPSPDPKLDGDGGDHGDHDSGDGDLEKENQGFCGMCQPNPEAHPAKRGLKPGAKCGDPSCHHKHHKANGAGSKVVPIS